MAGHWTTKRVYKDSAEFNRARLMFGNVVSVFKLFTALKVFLNVIAPVVKKIPIIGIAYYLIAIAFDACVVLANLVRTGLGFPTPIRLFEEGRTKRNLNNIVWAGLNTLIYLGMVIATPLLVVGYVFDFAMAAYNLWVAQAVGSFVMNDDEVNKSTRKLWTAGLLLVGMALLLACPLSLLAITVVSATACFVTRAIDAGFDRYASTHGGKQLKYGEGLKVGFRHVCTKIKNVWGKFVSLFSSPVSEVTRDKEAESAGKDEDVTSVAEAAFSISAKMQAAVGVQSGMRARSCSVPNLVKMLEDDALEGEQEGRPRSRSVSDLELLRDADQVSSRNPQDSSNASPVSAGLSH